MSSRNPSNPQTGTRPSPQTDPTNSYAQESVGIWVPAERETERHVDEPGLTDLDRQLREPRPDDKV